MTSSRASDYASCWPRSLKDARLLGVYFYFFYFFYACISPTAAEHKVFHISHLPAYDAHLLPPYSYLGHNGRCFMGSLSSKCISSLLSNSFLKTIFRIYAKQFFAHLEEVLVESTAVNGI